jgi:hypothetical protein
VRVFLKTRPQIWPGRFHCKNQRHRHESHHRQRRRDGRNVEPSKAGRARLSQRAVLLTLYCGALGQTRPTNLNRFKIQPVWLALAVMTIVPVALVFAVKTFWPLLWAGFQEHAHQTPSLTSWRWPSVAELLKAIRTAPGVLLALAFLPVVLRARLSAEMRQFAVLTAASIASAGVLVGALFFLTPNLVANAAYLQPLVVGAFLALWVGEETTDRRFAALKLCFGLAVLLVSVRAVGLTTLGVACAMDVSGPQARQLVASELARTPERATVAVSAAYLYDAWPQESRLKLLHCDWLGPLVRNQPAAEFENFVAARPTRLILTQFDYYRRYEAWLQQLQARPGVATVRVENLARVRPPDASPRWQRVVQHVSWAPVIVTLEWPE